MSLRRRACRAVWVLMVAAGVQALPQPASAQSGGTSSAALKIPEILSLIPYATPEAAVSSPYGAKLIDRIGAHWRANADAACIASKGLTPETFVKMAGAVTLKVGQRLQAETLKHFDAAAAEARFSKSAGADALAELRKLQADAKVRQYIDLQVKAAAGDLAQGYIGQIERAIRVGRFELRGETHPLTTGNGELIKEAEELDGAAAKFAEANATPEMKRFEELLVALGEAIVSAQDDKALAALGPAKLLDLIEKPLVDHCIKKV